MAHPSLPADQVNQISVLVAAYITDQRAKYMPRALPLQAEQRSAMADFFSPETLERARLLVLREGRVANPDFYPMLRSLGFDNLPDQSTMAAITFVDTVVSHVPFSEVLLFHELVHVEQYRQLGVEHFSSLYVHGFLNGGGYDGIPLERNAYILEDRFERDPATPFSVANEVEEWIAGDKF